MFIEYIIRIFEIVNIIANDDYIKVDIADVEELKEKRWLLS